jgi:hypothetical protein
MGRGTQIGLLLLAAMLAAASAQSIRTLNSSMVLEVAGATLTFAPAGSCAAPTSVTDSLLLQNDLQVALVAGIAGATNTQFSSQISSIGTTASSAAAQLAGLSTANAAISDAIASQVSSLTASLSSASGLTSQVSTRTAQVATSIDQQASVSLMALGALVAAQLTNTQAQLSTQVQTEITRASTAEAGLANAITTQASQTVAIANTMISSMVAQLLNETSTLRADNVALRSQLLTETSRATAAELLVASSVAASALTADSNLASAQSRQFVNFTAGITAESSRAIGVETSLNVSLLAGVSTAVGVASTGRVTVANTASTAVATEVSRAIGVESALSTLLLGFGATYASLPSVTGTLWAWHDGSDIGNNNYNSPAVQTNLVTWLDKGPNAIHMDQRTAGVASDVYFVPNAKNGRGAVFFNGNGIFTSSRQTTSIGGSITWFVVYKTSPSITERSLATLMPNNNPWINWYMAQGGRSERWEVGNGPITNTFSTLTQDTWVVAMGRSSPTAGLTHRNSLVAAEFIQTTPGVPFTPSPRGLMFASYAGANHNNFFAESIIFNTYLSDTDANIVFNWLRGKWAI